MTDDDDGAGASIIRYNPGSEWAMTEWGTPPTPSEEADVVAWLREAFPGSGGTELARLGALHASPRNAIPTGFSLTECPDYDLQLVVPPSMIGLVDCPTEETGVAAARRLGAEVPEIMEDGLCAFGMFVGDRRGDDLLAEFHNFYLHWTTPRKLVEQVAEILEPGYHIGSVANEASPFYWWCRGLLDAPSA